MIFAACSTLVTLKIGPKSRYYGATATRSESGPRLNSVHGRYPRNFRPSPQAAEISGHIHDLEKRIARQRANLANLDATIKLFSPGTNPDAIAPKRAYRRTRYFAHNELSRLTQDALRTASGLLTSAEIAGTVMQAKGIPSSDAAFKDYRAAPARETRDSSEVRTSRDAKWALAIA
jgi:hypothetical protein